MAAKIKICGIMRPDDAAFAVTAGASYLGVVFAEGPRRVTSDIAGEVVAAAGGMVVMGVFDDQPVDEILQICDKARLSGAQLHGSYSPPSAARLRAAGLKVWRVVRIAAPSDLDLLGEAIHESDAVLVEPKVPRRRGGAGLPLDLAVAREARARLTGHPMALAGGLTAETVSEALALVRPEIVDVSSGVERLPGIKDLDKIARFVEAVFAHSPIT
ncbi:MAG TPA: phosphoribosylanthranilate isomerase [Gemmatimonadales bacterium]|jgi:phosphoribosylanthranilate isomerase|nr:phosphoribosylanthranilate isomerase [Gemmatimonadales bacterium]